MRTSANIAAETIQKSISAGFQASEARTNPVATPKAVHTPNRAFHSQSRRVLNRPSENFAKRSNVSGSPPWSSVIWLALFFGRGSKPAPFPIQLQRYSGPGGLAVWAEGGCWK